jgi:VWFA-related protein
MRATPVVLTVLLAATVVAQTPQTPQTPPPQPPQPAAKQPVFRAGIDLLSVDATVLDAEGRQVTDLTPADFRVQVDGDLRPVVSAEYVKLVDSTPKPVGAHKVPEKAAPEPGPDYFSTNTRSVARGRFILIVVDQGNIRSGQGRGVMRSAVKFVDGLAAEDRVGLVGIPGPGPLVDFTSDHEKVREGLLATVGFASPYKGRFHISLSEAIATVDHSDALMRTQMILRECGSVLLSPVDAARCEIEVEQECAEIVAHQRQQTQNSVRGLIEVLKSLGRLDGPKSVIVISEGLVLEHLSNDADIIASVAADVRASLDVLLLDVPAVDVTEAQRPSTPREDRDLQVQGLEMLAGMSRGGLHRVIASADPTFARVMRSLAGHYLLAVESRPADRDGKRHRIEVRMNRRGLTVYSRRGFLAPTSPAATSPADAVGRALRAALTSTDVPMRLATWTYKEPGGSRVRLLVAAEVERSADQSLDYTAGLLLIDRDNKVVASPIETRRLEAHPADPATAVYAGALVIEPGSYLVRFAVADSEGRLGSVERKLEAWQLSGATVKVGDLLVGELSTDAKRGVPPAIEPSVSTGMLAAIVEAYGPTTEALAGLKGIVDVLSEENGKPLSSGVMVVGPGPTAEIGALSATLSTATLPPGRYLARATITDAGKPLGHFVRPFRVLPSKATTAVSGGGVSVPSVLPRELILQLMADLPAFDKQMLLTPQVLSSVITATEKARPAAGKAVFDTARSGKLGAAALDALGGGDQPVAAFLRGIDFFAQGQNDRAIQQFTVAMQQAPTLTPARLFLGAALAQANRHREAASLLQSVPADLAGAAVPQLAGVSWLKSGEIAMAIDALEKAQAGSAPDPETARWLALAYIVGNRPPDALPLLTTYLRAKPTDQAALLAGLYAIYARHSPAPQGATLAADIALAHTWAKAYAATKGKQQPIVDAWIGYLTKAK